MQTILLVENDAAILVARSLILRCFGYTVWKLVAVAKLGVFAASTLGRSA